MKKDSILIFILSVMLSYYVFVDNDRYFESNKTLEKDSIVQSLIAEQTGMVVTFH